MTPCTWGLKIWKSPLKIEISKLFYHRHVGCLSRGIEGTCSKITFFSHLAIAVLEKSLKNHLFSDYFQNGGLLSSFWDFSQKRLKQDRKKSWFLSICPQYLWIDTPHAYGRTTLKFRFLMGIFKFSDPCYGGSNVIFHSILSFP